MHKESNKQLKKNYQRSARIMGVFLIRNNLTNKVFVGSGLDLHGIINRHKFDLTNGSHRNKQLQSDWNELGSNNFAFEIVDQLTTRQGADVNYRDEINSLENLWIEKLQPFGERGYNQPPLTREERLRRIAKKK
jgi:group I intron endonuclease